jgi:hypothetical protein
MMARYVALLYASLVPAWGFAITKLSRSDISVSMQQEWLAATLSPSFQLSFCLLTYTVDDRYCSYIAQVTFKNDPKAGFIFEALRSFIFQLPWAPFSLEIFLPCLTLNLHVCIYSKTFIFLQPHSYACIRPA